MSRLKILKQPAATAPPLFVGLVNVSVKPVSVDHLLI